MLSLSTRASLALALAVPLCFAAGCSTQETVPVLAEKPAFCADEPPWRVPSCPCGCLSSLCIGTEASIGKTNGMLVCEATSAN